MVAALTGSGQSVARPGSRPVAACFRAGRLVAVGAQDAGHAAGGSPVLNLRRRPIPMKTKATFESLEPRSLCSVTPLGVNLIVNGDFEASIGNVTADPAKVTEVPGWNTMRGSCAAIAYGTRGFPTA